MSVNPLIPVNMASSFRIRRENNRNNSDSESSMSLSDFTESVSSGNKGFLGGLGEKLRKNFNYYLGSDNDEEDKKSERAEIDTRESNTISSVVEAEDLRQVQQQIPKIHDEKDQNQQKPEENSE